MLCSQTKAKCSCGEVEQCTPSSCLELRKTAEFNAVALYLVHLMGHIHKSPLNDLKQGTWHPERLTLYLALGLYFFISCSSRSIHQRIAGGTLTPDPPTCKEKV